MIQVRGQIWEVLESCSLCSEHILLDQIEKVFYELLKKMILMLLLHVMTTLTKLFCLLVASSSK